MTNPVITNAQRLYLIAVLYAEDVATAKNAYDQRVAYSGLGNCVLDLREMAKTKQDDDAERYLKDATAFLNALYR